MVLVVNEGSLNAAQLAALKELAAADGVTSYEEDTLLDAFCSNEAYYRLREFHGVTEDEDVERLHDDVQVAIKDVIDNDEPLYDKIDCAIVRVLEEDI